MGSMKGHITQADMVLLALYQASKGSTEKVPYEEIVLLVWKQFPDSFGLRNHPEHPDSSDVHKRLYQTLVPNDYAISLGHKIFRLTEKGQARGAKLLGIKTPAGEGGRLSRAEELFFKHAAATRAHRVWASGNKDELVDYDARLFFQFGPTATYDHRKRRLAIAIETLEHAKSLKLKDASGLLALAKALGKRFPNLFSGKEP